MLSVENWVNSDAYILCNIYNIHILYKNIYNIYIIYNKYNEIK